jgi:hypothetical protein
MQEFALMVMLTVGKSKLDGDCKDGLIWQLKIVRRYSEQMFTASVGQ